MPARRVGTTGGVATTGWREIAWRSYETAQDDRVLLLAAGVTFYGLLALFPATAAIVSLYGLFADPLSFNAHLGLLSGFLPQGALEVVGDQVKRITAKVPLRSASPFLAPSRFRSGAPMPAPSRSSMPSTSSIGSERSAV
jgi:uncharacterized BrkB/YihY/UPF0761 family membrane protein